MKKRILNYSEFITERYSIDSNESLILEGGAAGHMKHPFDDKSLTFGDFKKLIEAGLQGELNFEEEATEKTDGQNVFATVQDGEVKFARNKGDMKNPMSLSQFKDKFDGHPSKLVQDTFSFAAEDLADSLNKLSSKDLEIFDNGKNFMNMELIYSKNPNVIYYDRDVIQFHGIKVTDGEGNIIGEETKYANSIAKALKDLKLNIGKTFTVIPPQVIKLGKDIDFETNKNKFIKKVEDLKKKFDKEDVKKKQKENIRPFEDLFLELGSVILKNASNFVAANPDKEMQRLHTQIRTEADKIKKGGGAEQVNKVIAELDRLDRIGGIESIIPTEGVVFVYKGKVFKLTGTFAAINQLMGIIKYGN